MKIDNKRPLLLAAVLSGHFAHVYAQLRSDVSASPAPPVVSVEPINLNEEGVPGTGLLGHPVFILDLGAVHAVGEKKDGP